jgi:HEAT repeat protein
MSKGAKLALAVLAASASVCLIWFFPSNPEPNYNGRSLSEWLTICRATETPRDLREEAAAAVRHIGTNGLPFLLARASANPSQMRRKVSKFLLQHPTVSLLAPNAVFAWAHRPADYTRRNEARLGVLILGPSVAPAIPDLVRLAVDPSREDNSYWAVQTLGDIGPVALPALLTIITNPAAATRSLAASQVANFGTNAQPAIPELVALLGATNQAVIHAVIYSLGQLQLEPDVVIPALIPFVRSSDIVLSSEATFALAKFGTQAAAAAPAVLMNLTNPSPNFRYPATNALLRIAPQTLKHAPVR